MYSYLANIDSQQAIENAINDLDKLNTLIKSRRQFYKDNNSQKLRCWLIKGSLILDQYGDIAFFKPFKTMTFPNVVEANKIDCHGTTFAGGSKHSLPKKGSICPYCGHEVTIQDVYAHNFHVDNPTGSFAFHSGKCEEFHITFTDSFAVAKQMILISKRAFGEIEGVCVQEGDQKKYELVKISFMAVNHRIEILVMQHGSGLTITYDKNTEKGVILETVHYCAVCFSSFEEKLKEWKNTL